MASKNYTDFQPPVIDATWLNEVDGTVFDALGAAGVAPTTPAQVRTNLGLGTLALQNAGTVAITGGSISGITDLAVADGGTGLSGPYANGQLLIGNGTGFTAATLTAGANVAITNGAGSVTVAVASNLNADTVDTFHASQSATANTCAVRDASAQVLASTPTGIAADDYLTTRAYHRLHAVGSGVANWADVSASRAFDVVYQNTTGRPLMVSVTPTIASGQGDNTELYLEVGSSNPPNVIVGSMINTLGTTKRSVTMTTIVPPNHYYRVRTAVLAFGGSFVWAEM